MFRTTATGRPATGRPATGRPATGRPRRRRAARALLTALAVLAVLVTGPGTALAAEPGAAHTTGSTTSFPFVYPFLDCSVHNANGSWTVVFGYTNTGSTTLSLPAGVVDVIDPSPTYGVVPTSFAPGVHHAVVAVTVGASTSPTWTLGGVDVTISPPTATACPASLQLPADGNGAGPTLVLLAAGVVGALVLVRARRRALGGGAAARP
jgi:hypothetical protein